MEGLFSLLLFAALFYVMMRFGCGAHMVHGHGAQRRDQPVLAERSADADRHGGHGGHAGQGQGGQTVASTEDPVCGMAVDPDKGYTKVHEGRTYRFCSRACLDKFEATPQQYAA